MDYERNDDMIESSGLRRDVGPAAAPRKGSVWRVFWGLLLALSVLANVGLFLILLGVVAVFATGQSRSYDERVIQPGPRTSKIVVIRVQGIINDQQAGSVYEQLRSARRDRFVKGVIVRVNSPGGTISGSDAIYNTLLKYGNEEGVPVVAFMHGVAASGGYYVSVACDKIVAEPTVLTGSIGVIMGHFVFQKLLEDKLGITPVFLKEGQRKDWPSSFRQPTEQELQYLRRQVLLPAYERFIDIVAEGREDLTRPEVKKLADGGIMGALEAVDEKLVDEIGYLDDAVETVKSMAGIKRARVVEYRRFFSLASVLAAQSKAVFKLDRAKLYELTTPEVLYLWSAY